jgi:hypothetical protein
MQVVLAVVLSFPAPLLAQQPVPAGRLVPITAPIRDAGTVDVTTGRWTKPAPGTASTGHSIFDNTCSWTTQAYYASFDWCEENYDEGRIPSPSAPNSPAGAQLANLITRVQIGYCTQWGPQASVGGYDLDIAFWDKLDGDCLDYTPPTPPPASTTATAWLPLAGLGLPGSTAFGFLACWTVTLDTSNTGMVLMSDGEGTFDGTGAEDKFIWMQRQNVTTIPLALPVADGFLIAGEPASAGFGACTYSIPCGTDAFTGATCGTGLDIFDGSWINVDGIGVGSSGQPAGCVNSVAQYGFGTNCYFFGGYPTGPFASYWLELGVGGEPQAYCGQTKPTSVPGCTAVLTVSDSSLAGGVWSTTNIPRDAALAPGTSIGIYIYTHGVGQGVSTFTAATPFGKLCLTVFERSSPACSAAVLFTLPGQCNGGAMETEVDCNGGALGIQVGEDVNVQFWYRDPSAIAPGNSNLSNAVYYTVR